MTNVIERDEMTAAFAEAAETARSGTPEERSGKVLPVGAISELRQHLGLNREDFAKRYMVPLDTLQAWERGTEVPDAVASAYLRLIAADPVGIAARLASGSKPATTE